MIRIKIMHPSPPVGELKEGDRVLFAVVVFVKNARGGSGKCKAISMTNTIASSVARICRGPANRDPAITAVTSKTMNLSAEGVGK